MLEVRDLAVRFGGVTALSGVSFAVGPGELLLVTGANGAGKSTLLDALSGWTPISAGEVRVDGARVEALSPEGFVHRGVVRTFASGWTFDRLTVDENIQLAGADPRAEGVLASIYFGRSMRHSAGAAVGLDALDTFGLHRLLTSPSKTLSGGERKLLSLAMGLALRPRVFLLDEPLSQLSGSARTLAITWIRRLLASGAAVVVVEHLLDEVVLLATHRLHLVAGRAVQPGTISPDGLEGGPTPVSPTAPSAASSRLAVRGLSVKAGSRAILQDIDLDLGEGESLRIVGGNGSGKSTLLEAILGLKMSRGSRWVLGKDASHLAPHELARLGAAYVPQRGKCLPSLTVRENLLLAGEAVDQSGPGAVRVATELFPPLRALLDRPAHTLSSGERQMVALSYGLHRRTPLLLLDEPSLGLSVDLWAQVKLELERRRRAGTSLLVVEHRSSPDPEPGTRCLQLREGRMLVEGR